MEISYLADRPEFIEVLAPWIHAHWRPILVDETLESRKRKLRMHLNRDTLPIALVAHAGAEVYGTAALRVHDLHGREDLTPWLGGVFVGAPYRRTGIGARLCTEAEEKAKVLFPGAPLYLFTLDKQAWYQKMGWSLLQACSWRGREGSVMTKRLT